jgi:hypothetical protein
MRLIFLVFLCTLIFFGAPQKNGGPPKNKPAAEYEGVDPSFKPFVNEYKSLAKNHDINFTNEVTVGFADITYKDVVGLCNYGENFREIDIDRRYWDSASDRTRKTLIFHELTHCYCLRKHDYGENQPYPEINRNNYAQKGLPPLYYVSPGFFVDGCAITIMHPYVLSDSCAVEHNSHYEDEMFERCQPY